MAVVLCVSALPVPPSFVACLPNARVLPLVAVCFPRRLFEPRGTTWYPVLERRPNETLYGGRVSSLYHRGTGCLVFFTGSVTRLRLPLSLSAPRDVTLRCHGYFVTVDVSFFLVEIGAMWSAAVAGTPFAWLFR